MFQHVLDAASIAFDQGNILSLVSRRVPTLHLSGAVSGRGLGDALSNPGLIGRKYDHPDIDRDRRLLPYKVIRASNGDAWVEVRRKQYSPQEISAMILQKLKGDAEIYLRERVSQAVITVPAYFDNTQRQATRDAGKIAGIEVLRMINEPTAASLAYGRDGRKDETILVYDLGGGSFDVSILEVGHGVFEVKSTNGNTHLGGDDFDQQIITWLVEGFREAHHIDLRQDRVALQRLKDAAEKAKRDLSSQAQVEIDLPYIAVDSGDPKNLSMLLTRTRVEEMVKELIERTREPVQRALKDADLKANNIDKVILVGAQTRMPAVRTYVAHLLGREPAHTVHPDEAVAIGAAIQAGVLVGDVKDILLVDVVPLSLGIEVKGTSFTRLISRNTTIPTKKGHIFSTSQDNQETIDLKVLQGESEFSADNRLLGSLTLDGIPPAPHGVPEIEVTFEIDADGLLDVSARDKGSGREQRVTIAPSRRNGRATGSRAQANFLVVTPFPHQMRERVISGYCVRKRPFSESRNRPLNETYGSTYPWLRRIISLVNFKSGLQECLWKHAPLQTTSERIFSQKETSMADVFPHERVLGESHVRRKERTGPASLVARSFSCQVEV